MTEIMRNKVVHGAEGLFAKPELVEGFNAEVDRKLRPQLGPQLQSRPPQQQRPQSEEVLFNEVLTITLRPSDYNTLRLLDFYSSKYLDYQSLNTLDFSTLWTKVIDFSSIIYNMLNNITKNLASNRQEAQTVKESKLEQLSKSYAFCGICRKSVSEPEYSAHKEIHFISKFQQKYNNRKSYLNSYLDRLNLTAQLKLNQIVRPMLKTPKVNQQRTTNQKTDYLGRAILSTHMKLASESYW